MLYDRLSALFREELSLLFERDFLFSINDKSNEKKKLYNDSIYSLNWFFYETVAVAHAE